VKYLRTFLLVLLTVLLPIRGAVAAAMLCPAKTATVSTAADAGHGEHEMRGGHDIDAHHTAVRDHSHGEAPHDAASGGHATACQFCAGGCCVTPLAFATPSVESPCLTASAVFPALTARVAAYYSDGQDRPPRTI
jgi:hypothetical protein